MVVSIITPLYNNADYIGLTIESVQSQSFSDWEMIIIDDGSTDNSVQIVNHYAEKDNRLRLLTQEHQGSAAARNRGIRAAQGRYICLLDSDDIWAADFLKSQLQLLQMTDSTIVCAGHNRIDENGNECLQPFIPPLQATYEDLLKTCSISCLTAVYDTAPFGKFYLKENFALRDDYVLWLQIVKKAGVVYGNRRVLASYRMAASRKSAHKIKTIMPQWRVYRQVEQIGFFKSIYYLLCWAMNGIKKYSK